MHLQLVVGVLAGGAQAHVDRRDLVLEELGHQARPERAQPVDALGCGGAVLTV